MPRPVLDESAIHPDIRASVAGLQAGLLNDVRDAVARHPVVVVGMAQNPFVRRAKQALDQAGITYQYLGYGSYLSGWRRRNAVKMWTGWPTFPMVFVRGMLVGGATDVERLLLNGELRRLLG